MRRQHEQDINTGEHFDALYAGPRRQEMLADPSIAFMLPCVAAYHVLDVGCGWGQYRKCLRGCLSYTGIDFAPEAIEQAKQAYPAATWVQHDFTDGLPFDSARFHAILCLEVLEHLEEPRRLIREIRRVLFPSGLAIFSVPYRDQIKTPEHLWEFEESDWPDLLSEFHSHALFRYGSHPHDPWEHFLVLARK